MGWGSSSELDGSSLVFAVTFSLRRFGSLMGIKIARAMRKKSAADMKARRRDAMYAAMAEEKLGSTLLMLNVFLPSY